MFVGLGVSSVLPVCQGIAIYGYHELENRMGLNWVVLQGFLYIFGAFLYAVSNYCGQHYCHKCTNKL